VIAFDANVLLGAHRDVLPYHADAAELVERAASDTASFGLPDAVLAAVVRIATNEKVFAPPSTHGQVFAFLKELIELPNAVIVRPGEGHWGIFERLCRQVGARGNLVTDAWLAALAIEHDCEWISFDGDFARFPELRWRHPSD
jgi:toxin-antitoxin system PIN domain toxin